MKITITGICPFCGRETMVEVDMEQCVDWAFRSVPTQDAFPTLSATERETLISGICPDCQDDIFIPDDEDDY